MTSRRTWVAVGLTIALVFGFCVAARAGEAPDASRRQEIETVVRDYLRAHPEVVLEALQEMERREQERQRAQRVEAIRAHLVQLTQDPGNPVGGNPENVRANLREGLKLLKEAGYEVRERRLIEVASGRPLSAELLVEQPDFERIMRQPLAETGNHTKYNVLVNVEGGGPHGQVEAIRHGVARALLKASASNRFVLKKAGFLTRDPRMKERKKYGLRKARRASQFSKR